MCGRIQVPPRHEIIASEHVRGATPDTPSHMPSQVTAGMRTPVITSRHLLTMMHWGFGDIYNARSESLTEKRFWQPYVDNRVLMPLTRFFEGGKWFSHQGEIIFAAGIFRAVNDGKKMEVAMLTTAANDRVSPYHPRMPLLVTGEDAEEWLVSKKELITA